MSAQLAVLLLIWLGLPLAFVAGAFWWKIASERQESEIRRDERERQAERGTLPPDHLRD